MNEKNERKNASRLLLKVWEALIQLHKSEHQLCSARSYVLAMSISTVKSLILPLPTYGSGTSALNQNLLIHSIRHSLGCSGSRSHLPAICPNKVLSLWKR